MATVVCCFKLQLSPLYVKLSFLVKKVYAYQMLLKSFASSLPAHLRSVLSNYWFVTLNLYFFNCFLQNDEIGHSSLLLQSLCNLCKVNTQIMFGVLIKDTCSSWHDFLYIFCYAISNRKIVFLEFLLHF